MNARKHGGKEARKDFDTVIIVCYTVKVKDLHGWINPCFVRFILGEVKSVKKKLAIIIAAVLLLLLNVAVFFQKGTDVGMVTLRLKALANQTSDYTIWYASQNDGWSPERSVTGTLKKGKETVVEMAVPSDLAKLRIDFGEEEGSFVLSELSFTDGEITENFDLSALTLDEALESNLIASSVLQSDRLFVEAKAEDPYLSASVHLTKIPEKIKEASEKKLLIKKVLYFILLDGMAFAMFLMRRRFFTLGRELYQNRKLIRQLARNDFKTRYAGSVFGIIWAFIQPLVTVLVYWFVFGRLGSGPVASRTGEVYPFVLWLIAGLVPWFFFQDALSGGTGAMQEYSYLVKKVVFKISILPIVKEISVVYVHFFFIALTAVLYMAAGHFPDLYWLQMLYYSGALFLYALGIIYMTCSIVVFFKDLSQMISIILQVQVWMTPIMWNWTAYSGRLPKWATSLLKINPLFYIVQGYRDSLMEKVWFWEHFDMTVYFWIITAVFFALGTFVFKRLKVHFADIL